ncbi:MAG: IclR family transcriptional regulator domain-containing protein [Acidimicrobiales bacterium]
MDSISVASTADRDGSPSVPRSIERVLDVFEIVLAQRACNLTVAAKESGLTATTALRYLRALEARGYIHRDEAGDFSAGPTILRVAASLRDDGELDRLTHIAQRHLDQLAETTGESVYLAVGDGKTATYIAAAESKRAIRHVGWVGQDVPRNDSALGEALDNPGSVMIRTGAVEPDVTAMSLALPKVGRLDVAVSIVGPVHRFLDQQVTAFEAALATMVDQLKHDLGLAGEELTR